MYYPTEEIVNDYSSKSLQGSKFIELRNIIQGINDDEFNDYQKHNIETPRQFDLFDLTEVGDNVS